MKLNTNEISLVLITALFLLSGLHINAQQSKYDEEISEDLLKLGREKFQLIKDDLSASEKNEWEGIYGSIQGNTVSTSLVWSESSGYFTHWYNCSRPFTERINYGAVEFSNNRLKINPALNEKKKSSHTIAAEFVPVKWDEQHFLIPQNELLNFAYAVHSNSESEIENFLVKSGDGNKSRKGFPNLPKEFEKFLTMKAIKPKIRAIKTSDEDRIRDTEITLDKGRADNVIERMVFYVLDSSGDIELMITDVQENTSKARIVSIAGDAKPKIGMKFTSRVPDNFSGY